MMIRQPQITLTKHHDKVEFFLAAMETTEYFMTYLYQLVSSEAWDYVKENDWSCFLVVGEGGSGKTSVIRNLMDCMTEGSLIVQHEKGGKFHEFRAGTSSYTVHIYERAIGESDILSLAEELGALIITFKKDPEYC